MNTYTKKVEIKLSEVREFEIAEAIQNHSTKLSVKRNDKTTVYGDIYAQDKQELESFINQLEALPELIDSIEFWLALDRTKAEGNEEIKRIHELTKQRFCKVMELVYNGK